MPGLTLANEPGSLLTLVSPAGTFETFIRDTARLSETASTRKR